MNIVYCFNDTSKKSNKEQILLLGASLISLFENHINNNVNIYVVIYKIFPENLNKLKEIQNKYNVNISYIYFPKRLEGDLKYMMERSIPANAGTFLRLFLGILLPDKIDKLLYIDTDTIINRNFYIFYNNFTFDGNDIGAVLDPYTPFRIEKEKQLQLEKGSYINAGILFINISKLRNTLLPDCIEVFKKYNQIFADQDAINIAYNNSTKLISSDINNIVTEHYNKYAFIHHYASRGKLFHINPAIIHKEYKNIFWKYIEMVGVLFDKPKIHCKDIIIFVVYFCTPIKLINFINSHLIYK